MTYNWTDGPELSILLVNANGRDYAAEAKPDDELPEGYSWCIYRDARSMAWGVGCGRYHAKLEAEQTLTALIEKDFNEHMEGDK